MRFNVLPLKGKKNSYPKSDVGKNFPKWKKTDFYDKPIPDNVNTVMITGVHPLHSDLQIIVLDFDGPSHGEVGWSGLTSILHAVRSSDLEPYMIRRTGNGGFHLVYICDTIKILRNEQNKGLDPNAKTLFDSHVGDIDIRANGGLVFWDCKFSDTDAYTTISKQSEIIITRSDILSKFIDILRPVAPEKTAMISEIKTSKRTFIKDGKSITLYNCTDYDIPEKHFHKFNQLRRAIKDIWTGVYIITKGPNEFRMWAIFWRECLARGIPQYVVLNRLRTGVQPEYDEEDTVNQLTCLKYKNVTPNRNYYLRIFPSYR